MKTCKIDCPGRDQVELEFDWNDGKLIVYKHTALGCYEFTENLKGFLESLAMGQCPNIGKGHVGFMLRELLLRIHGQWTLPYDETELCHCRVVPTEKVCQAIRAGADSVEKVSQWTSASTACGSCKPDVESLIAYYQNASLAKP